MLADYFTKPLTGSLFFKLRDQVMNLDPSYTIESDEELDRRSVLGMHASGKDVPHIQRHAGLEPGWTEVPHRSRTRRRSRLTDGDGRTTYEEVE
jgi:hypothetical protein